MKCTSGSCEWFRTLLPHFSNFDIFQTFQWFNLVRSHRDDISRSASTYYTLVAKIIRWNYFTDYNWLRLIFERPATLCFISLALSLLFMSSAVHGHLLLHLFQVYLLNCLSFRSVVFLSFYVNLSCPSLIFAYEIRNKLKLSKQKWRHIQIGFQRK